MIDIIVKVLDSLRRFIVRFDCVIVGSVIYVFLTRGAVDRSVACDCRIS